MSGREKLAARAGSPLTEFRLPPPPNLREHLSGAQLMEGFRKYSEATAQHWQDVERAINEKFAQLSNKIPPSGT